MALIAIDRALSLNKNLAEAYNTRGILLLQKGEREEAERSFKLAIGLRPDYEKAYSNLVRAYLEDNQLHRAFDCQKQATTSNPSSNSYSVLGHLCLQLKKYQDGVKAFEEAIKLGDNRKETLSNLAYAYFANEQTDKALLIYRQLEENVAPKLSDEKEGKKELEEKSSFLEELTKRSKRGKKA